MKRNRKKLIRVFMLVFVFSVIFTNTVSAENVSTNTATPIVKRIGGKNRIMTSVKVSQNTFKYNSDTVILIGSRGEIDALGGTLLASKLDAPIIMTDKSSLTAETKTEIERLKPKNIIILGGENVVSKKVEESLSEYNVERIGGKDREETAINIAKRALPDGTDEVFLGLGYNVYADALAIGVVTAKINKPLFLTKKNSYSIETQNELKRLNIKKVTIVGGTSVVSEIVEEALTSSGIIVDRISGENREETSIKIAETYFKNPKEVIVANGYTFADSVIGGYYAYKIGAPIILTKNNNILDSTLNYVNRIKKDTTILGMYGAIDETVEKKLNKALEIPVAEESSSGKADLIAYIPDNWEDSIIINNSSDPKIKTEQLSIEDDIYLHFAYGNIGEVDVDKKIYIQGVLDGKPHVEFINKGGLKANHFNLTAGLNLGKMKVGEHDYKIILDYNNSINEANKDNNVLEISFHISADIPELELKSTSEVEKFLSERFGTLNTNIGTTNFEFDIYENDRVYMEYDYWIQVKFNSNDFWGVMDSINYTNEQKDKLRDELREHQKNIGETLTRMLPDKKLTGGYYKSWYRYPALKVDLITRNYYSWANYERTSFGDDAYEKTKPSYFRWTPINDDVL